MIIFCGKDKVKSMVFILGGGSLPLAPKSSPENLAVVFSATPSCLEKSKIFHKMKMLEL